MMTARSQLLLLACLFASLALAIGCQSKLTHSQEKFGSATSKAKVLMTQSPDPPSQADMDGLTAEHVAENYHYNQDAKRQAERTTEPAVQSLKN